MFEDLVTVYRKDPALHGIRGAEAILYAGVWALWSHRVAHLLWTAGVPLLPRLLSQVTRTFTGIEIHPGATIGHRLFIDHGSGVVIGETAEIGDDVVMYHGVTLGGRGWWRDAKGSKRHPTIGDRVTLAVGSSVLGPVHVGDDARVGAHAVVLDDVPAGATVYPPTSVVSLRRSAGSPVAGSPSAGSATRPTTPDLSGQTR